MELVMVSLALAVYIGLVLAVVIGKLVPANS
jgi:hypothetical protein